MVQKTMTSSTPGQLQQLDKCRKMLVGKTIRGVMYAQYDSDREFADAGEVPPVLYKTDSPDLDEIESSFYLTTEKKTYRFSWMVSHLDYGLEISEINTSEIRNDEEYLWDVSAQEKWKPLMGQKITDLHITWKKSWSSNLLSKTPYDIVFPHTYVLETESKQKIILASEVYDDEDIKPFINHLKITTNSLLAKELKLI